MDHYSETIDIYDKKCHLEKRVMSRVHLTGLNVRRRQSQQGDEKLADKLRIAREEKLAKNSPNMIFHFVFSETEQRLGAVISNGTFSLWDARDNFKYEKNIASKYFNTWIFYIEFQEKWMTCDKQNNLHIWNIHDETPERSYPLHKEVKGIIQQAVEIRTLKLIVIGTSDKMISVFDPYKMKLTMSVLMAKGGINDIKYFNTYQSQLISGYDNVVPIFSITPGHNDLNFVGKLKGHLSNVVAIEVIEDTPMVITADGTPVVRTWDIRRFQCQQSIPFPNRMALGKLVTLKSVNKLAIIGTRLTVIDFCATYDKKNEKKTISFPIFAEIDKNRSLIYLATVNEIRTIDMLSGRVQNIFTNLADSETPDELSKFRLIEKGRTFVVSNAYGSILLFRAKTGEQLQKIEPHKSIVTNMKYDSINNLILSSSSDGVIKVQKISDNEDMDVSTDEIQKMDKNALSKNRLRVMENIFDGNSVDFIDVSLEMNLIACSSSDETVCFIDYEYFKVICCFVIGKGVECTYQTFLQRYSQILIADNTGDVHLLHIHYKHLSSLKINSLYKFNITTYVNRPADLPQFFCNKIYVDFKFSQPEYDKFNRHQTQETQKYMEWYLAINDGTILRFDVQAFVKVWKLAERSYDRANYNAMKTFVVDYMKHTNLGSKITECSTKDSTIEDALLLKYMYPNLTTFDQNECNYISMKVHKELITSIHVSRIPDQRILTTSQDFYFKIFDENFNLLCKMNVNHAQPTEWDLKYSKDFEILEKIVRGLEYINNLMSESTQKVMKTNFDDMKQIKSSMSGILKDMKMTRSLQEISQFDEVKTKIKSSMPQILTMKNEYSPRDMAYEKILKDDVCDIAGPQLKEIDASGKANTIDKKNSLEIHEEDRYHIEKQRSGKLKDIYDQEFKLELDRKRNANSMLKKVIPQEDIKLSRTLERFAKKQDEMAMDGSNCNTSSLEDINTEENKHDYHGHGYRDAKQRKSGSKFILKKKHYNPLVGAGIGESDTKERRQTHHKKSKSFAMGQLVCDVKPELNIVAREKHESIKRKHIANFYDYAGQRNLVKTGNSYNLVSAYHDRKNVAMKNFLAKTSKKGFENVQSQTGIGLAPSMDRKLSLEKTSNKQSGNELDMTDTFYGSSMQNDLQSKDYNIFLGKEKSTKVKDLFTDNSALLSYSDQCYFFRTVMGNMNQRLNRVALNNSYYSNKDFLSNTNCMKKVMSKTSTKFGNSEKKLKISKKKDSVDIDGYKLKYDDDQILEESDVQTPMRNSYSTNNRKRTGGGSTNAKLQKIVDFC